MNSSIDWDIERFLEQMSLTDCLKAKAEIEDFLETHGGRLFLHAVEAYTDTQFDNLCAVGRGNARADDLAGVTNGRLDVLSLLLQPALGLGDLLAGAAKKKGEA